MVKCIMQMNKRSNVIGAKFVTCLKHAVTSRFDAQFLLCSYTKSYSVKFIGFAGYICRGNLLGNRTYAGTRTCTGSDNDMILLTARLILTHHTIFHRRLLMSMYADVVHK